MATLSRPSTSDEAEKGPTVADTPVVFDNLDETRSDGDFQVQKTDSLGNVKLAKDGVTVLIPQPSDDPADPLNWPLAAKIRVLVALGAGALLTDFGMTWGSTLFEAQAPTFNLSVAAMSNSISGGIFMQGPAGCLAVPLVERYGRLPVLFWSQLLSCIVVLVAALSPSYACFTAFRTLQGTFNTAPQVIGLSVVHDMFFFHERTRVINIWVFCFLGGPFLGPFLAAWIIQGVNWRADYGVLAGLYGFSALLVVLLGKETLYDRAHPIQQESGILGRIKLLVGITGARMVGRPSIWSVGRQIISIWLRPQIFFLTSCFITVLVMWVIGINTTVTQLTIPAPYYFSSTAIALSFLAPLIGAITGEIWGHFFNDWLCARYITSHRGSYAPENRLWGAWAPALLGVAGLVLFGQTLQHGLHWIGLLFGWGMAAFAMVSATTVISAYCLDSFPGHAAVVASIINFWRTTGGFCVTYFQLKWIARNGAAVSFGCQAAILAAAFVGGVVVTQIWGKKWRLKYPAPKVEHE